MSRTNVTSLSVDLDDQTWQHLVARATAAAEAEQRVTDNLNRDQRGRSWALGTDVTCSPRPVWTSRRMWLAQTALMLELPEGIARCRQHRIAESKVKVSAYAMASAADSRTGRRVTMANEHLAARAGVSVTVLRRARRVLRDLGLAYEVARGRTLTGAEYRAAHAHHGGQQHRAASTWALSSPARALELLGHVRAGKHASARFPQLKRRGHLSRRSLVRETSLVRTSSSKRACARSPRQRDCQPKPLHAQRAAACIASRITALKMGGRDVLAGKNHIGGVVAVLIAEGIDTTRWDGDAIVDRLNAESIARNITMPRDLARPMGWLRMRLRLLDWDVPSPSEKARAARSKLRIESELRRGEMEAAWARAAAPNSPARRQAVEHWRNFPTEPDHGCP